ncbi:MAG: hypothetical protein EA350_15910, partial [Gemmatimonadales bacterium]
MDSIVPDTTDGGEPFFTLFPGREAADTAAGPEAGTRIMAWSEGAGLGEVADLIYRVLNFPLFSIGETYLTLSMVFVTGILIILTWWVSNLLQRTLDRTFRARGVT